jgi:hypothetical protein
LAANIAAIGTEISPLTTNNPVKPKRLRQRTVRRLPGVKMGLGFSARAGNSLSIQVFQDLINHFPK